MRKKGFSIVEMMVVLAIFTVLFAAIFTVFTASSRSWRIGQNKLSEQQEARKAMSQITRLLRQASPEWTDASGNTYPVSISPSAERIDFYLPRFLVDGQISSFRKVTFKPNPDNPRQLLKKEGAAAALVVALEIEGINFACVDASCSQVEVEITTGIESEFVLNSQVALRNTHVNIPPDIVIEQPEEGEF